MMKAIKINWRLTYFGLHLTPIRVDKIVDIYKVEL